MINCLEDVPTWMLCRGSKKASCRVFIPWLVLTNSPKPRFCSQPSLGWRAQHRNALPLPVQLLPPPQGPGSVGMKWNGMEVGWGGDGFCCGWNYNVNNSEKSKAVHLALCIYLQKRIKAIKFKYSLLLECTVLTVSLWWVGIEKLTAVNESQGSSSEHHVWLLGFSAIQTPLSLPDELSYAIQTRLEWWKEPEAPYIMQSCCCYVIIFNCNAYSNNKSNHCFPYCGTKIIETALFSLLLPILVDFNIWFALSGISLTS